MNQALTEVQPGGGKKHTWEEHLDKAKSYDIPRRVVKQAWELVKAKRGGGGIDGQEIRDFEKNLKDNLYRIWNRMSSGSYFPPAVKVVEIPKKDGGKRKLGIPTVASYCTFYSKGLVLRPKFLNFC